MDHAESTAEEWLLLKSVDHGMPVLVAVLPSLPSSEFRLSYPVLVKVSVPYDANEEGLPQFADDLQTLNELERDFRSWDPESKVFVSAARKTGGGQRQWLLYAKSAEAFFALVPENDFIVVAAESDPGWRQVSAILKGVQP